jgi:hypothetical protein
MGQEKRVMLRFSNNLELGGLGRRRIVSDGFVTDVRR